MEDLGRGRRQSVEQRVDRRPVLPIGRQRRGAQHPVNELWAVEVGEVGALVDRVGQARHVGLGGGLGLFGRQPFEIGGVLDRRRLVHVLDDEGVAFDQCPHGGLRVRWEGPLLVRGSLRRRQELLHIVVLVLQGVRQLMRHCYARHRGLGGSLLTNSTELSGSIDPQRQRIVKALKRRGEVEPRVPAGRRRRGAAGGVDVLTLEVARVVGLIAALVALPRQRGAVELLAGGQAAQLGGTLGDGLPEGIRADLVGCRPPPTSASRRGRCPPGC